MVHNFKTVLACCSWVLLFPGWFDHDSFDWRHVDLRGWMGVFFTDEWLGQNQKPAGFVRA